MQAQNSVPAAPASNRRRHELKRSMRLRTRQEFLRVRDQGRRLARGCLIANWFPQPGETPSRLGVITSRKLGKATIRTRARRLLREAFRRHQHDLQKSVELVLVARSSIADKKLADVERDLLAVLRQANLLK
ncbi:MAG: ribonuclease P protein component [Verrucomicrobia bacterium]|nr:ribonuclease P protein component [Verrucomicrobiota bacterium]